MNISLTKANLKDGKFIHRLKEYLKNKHNFYLTKISRKRNCSKN